MVACAAGANVAKHGNRSVSGICGSADFLEAIGISMQAPPEKVKSSIEEVGMGFLYAPMFHPSMKNAANARKAIGVRTAFNIIGPLSNPCTNLSGQVIGVFGPALMDLVAEAYQGYVNDAMIVHAADGFDELSNTCENDVLMIRDGARPQRLRIHPKALNIPVAKPEDLVVNSRDESIRSTLQVIYGKATPEKEDIVVMNAAAALVVARIASDLKEGVAVARSSIKSGKAQAKLEKFVEFNGSAEKLIEAEKRFL
jgi:anthranilate phosphoribosyltransferase